MVIEVNVLTLMRLAMVVMEMKLLLAMAMVTMLMWSVSYLQLPPMFSLAALSRDSFLPLATRSENAFPTRSRHVPQER